ncbi:MAG: hypothetical protein C0622_03835 [Desulfuromonas sp.]|nr:MAG: hypothetical protein C0622_03835 [Desulfuromonas sp.]
MEPAIYKIRKNFLLPLGLVVLLGCILMISTIYLGLPKAKIIILGAFLIPAFILFVESSLRRVHLFADAIQVDKALRKKRIPYAELTAVDTIQVRKRIFISLSSENDFLILSNSYGQFGQLVNELIAKVPDEIISAETRNLAAAPPKKCSDVFSAWLAVAVLALIIYVQLRGTF